MTKYYSRQQMQQIAEANNLGYVFFNEKIALNTGKPMEIGYVEVGDTKTLFCKKGSINPGFYLCNDFRELDSQLQRNEES